MGTIEIHDGVTNREIQVQNFPETVEIHLGRRRIVVPAGYEVLTEDEIPRP